MGRKWLKENKILFKLFWIDYELEADEKNKNLQIKYYLDAF
jgi:hypothetical protein